MLLYISLLCNIKCLIMKYLKLNNRELYNKFVQPLKRPFVKYSFYFFILLALSLTSCSRVSLNGGFVDVESQGVIPFEHISGSTKYGFGICKVNNKITKMTFKPNYKEIERFKLFLKENGYTDIERTVSSMEFNAKTGNSKMYAVALEQYYTEIEKLDDPEGLFDRFYR